MRLLIYTGVWACSATLAATYGGFYYRTHPAQSSVTLSVNHIKPRDLKTITVPIIRNGQIRGYITAEFSIIGQSSEPHEQSPDIDSYVLDEAYRLIYSEADVDFDFIRQTDLARLTSDIKSRVNSRLGKEALQDVLVSSFHYVSSEDVKKNGN